MRLGFISSYVPKKCGIATFNRDLIEGVKENYPDIKTYIAAAETPEDSFTYDNSVITTLKTDNKRTYHDAARLFNNLELDAVVLQHEFGLYGGTWAEFTQHGVPHKDPTGDYILEMLDIIKRPVITTLHTVVPEPDEQRRGVIRRIAQRSASVIAMSQDSKRILSTIYNIEPGKITVIPHGVPTATSKDRTTLLRELKLDAKNFYLTITGLIGQNKGIDTVIKALPNVIKNHPNVRLLVIGQTHPQIIAAEGEKYRNSLKALARKLKVDHAVTFINKYLATDVLMKYIAASDAYLTIHRDAQQSTSGTLAYAIGAGRIAIATPYRYAQELLANENGFLVPFDSPTHISDVVNSIVENDDLRANMHKKLRRYGAQMAWPAIGKSYITLIEDHIATYENAIL